MLYVPAKKFRDAEESNYQEVTSNDWWWNEQLCMLNFVIATIILTTSIATVADWI